MLATAAATRVLLYNASTEYSGRLSLQLLVCSRLGRCSGSSRGVAGWPGRECRLLQQACINI